MQHWAVPRCECEYNLPFSLSKPFTINKYMCSQSVRLKEEKKIASLYVFNKMPSSPLPLWSCHTSHQNGDRIINVCARVRNSKHLRGSDKYNWPEETIKPQLPSFPSNDIYSPTVLCPYLHDCVCVCVYMRGDKGRGWREVEHRSPQHFPSHTHLY